jgi:cAMP-dependent protein kinase regulator
MKRNMSKYSDMELPAEPEAVQEDAEMDAQDDSSMHVDEPPQAAMAGRQGRRKNVFMQAVTLEADWVAPSYAKGDEEKAKLSDFLAKTSLLAHLDPKSKATVIDAFQKKDFTNGDNIITQGDEGDYYYILDSGSADALLSKPPGSPEVKVFEYGVGGAFGELALIHGEPRAATVRATSDCVTYALDRDTFRKIMKRQGQSDMQQRVTLLARVSILEELAPFERFKIAEAMEVRTYEDGELIIAEGDPGTEFFIIQQGACHCFKRTLKF